MSGGFSGQNAIFTFGYRRGHQRGCQKAGSSKFPAAARPTRIRWIVTPAVFERVTSRDRNERATTLPVREEYATATSDCDQSNHPRAAISTCPPSSEESQPTLPLTVAKWWHGAHSRWRCINALSAIVALPTVCIPTARGASAAARTEGCRISFPLFAGGLERAWCRRNTLLRMRQLLGHNDRADRSETHCQCLAPSFDHVSG